MKKLLTVLTALLITTGAFAQEEGKGPQFNYDVFGVAYGALGSMGSKDKWDYQHIRIRPRFVAENENIKAVVRLQIDQTFGTRASNAIVDDDGAGTVTSVASDNENGTAINARHKAVKVQFAYLELSNLFVDGLSFTAGLNEYYFPLVADIEGALTGASYDFGMGTVGVYYLKLYEGHPARKALLENQNTVGTGPEKAVFNVKNEAQVYIFDITVKPDDKIAIRPAFLYATSEKDARFGGDYKFGPKMKAYIGALNTNADLGMAEFDVTGAYLSYKAGVGAAKQKWNAYAFDLGLNVKPDDSISIGVFTTYTSGSNKQDKKGFSEILGVGLFPGSLPAGRLFLLQGAGMNNTGGYAPTIFTDDEGLNYLGLGNTVFGLSAQFTVNKLTILAQYGYMMASKKKKSTGADNGDKNIGQEVDVKISLEVAPKTNLFVEGARVMAGDKSFVPDNASQVLWGLVTRI